MTRALDPENARTPETAPNKKESLVRAQIFLVSLALSLASASYAQAPTPAAAPPPPPGPAAVNDGATTFVVTFKVKAGKEADFEQAFREMANGVREHEPGNIYYELYKTSEPQTYVVIERYKDAAAITAHGQSAHGRKLFAALRDLMDGRPQAQRLIYVLSK